MVVGRFAVRIPAARIPPKINEKEHKHVEHKETHDRAVEEKKKHEKDSKERRFYDSDKDEDDVAPGYTFGPHSV